MYVFVPNHELGRNFVILSFINENKRESVITKQIIIIVGPNHAERPSALRKDVCRSGTRERKTRMQRRLVSTMANVLLWELYVETMHSCISFTFQCLGQITHSIANYIIVISISLRGPHPRGRNRTTFHRNEKWISDLSLRT